MQNSGLAKLTGSAGSQKSIYYGIKLLMEADLPTWGVVTPEIAGMMKKIGFIVPSKFTLATLFKFIPKSVLGGADVNVNPDGTLTVTSDMGTINKLFVGNKKYFMNIITSSPIADKIPNVIKLWVRKL